MTIRGADERGLTLTEMMIVIVLAAMVMTGIATFYLNAQSIWVNGSAQTITQREATLVLTGIAKVARRAVSAGVSGTTLCAVTLTLPAPAPNVCFWWNPGDSLVYEGPDLAHGTPMLASTVECFAVHVVGAQLVVDSLRVRSAEGSRVVVGSSVTLMNWSPP